MIRKPVKLDYAAILRTVHRDDAQERPEAKALDHIQYRNMRAVAAWRQRLIRHQEYSK